MQSILKKFASGTNTGSALENTFNQIPLVLSILILDKTLIAKNSELKPLANVIGDTVYKDYLFHSRTSLFARLVKDTYIFANTDDDKYKVIENVQRALLLLSDSTANEKNVDSKKSSSKKESPTQKWQRIIGAD